MGYWRLTQNAWFRVQMGHEQVQDDNAGAGLEAGPFRQGCKADGPRRVSQDEHSEDSQFVEEG